MRIGVAEGCIIANIMGLEVSEAMIRRGEGELRLGTGRTSTKEWNAGGKNWPGKADVSNSEYLLRELSDNRS